MDSDNNFTEELALNTDSDYYTSTDLHYQDILSARDICEYKVEQLTIPDGVKSDKVELPDAKLYSVLVEALVTRKYKVYV